MLETTQKIRERLLKLHGEENDLNRQMAKIDAEVKVLQRRKSKLVKMVSANMKYRNMLINKL